MLGKRQNFLSLFCVKHFLYQRMLSCECGFISPVIDNFSINGCTLWLVWKSCVVGGALHCITRSRVNDIQWGTTLEVLRSPDCSLADVCLLLRVRLWRCKQPGQLAVWVSGRKGAVHLCIIPAFIHLCLSQNITGWYLINRNVFLTVTGNPEWRRYQQNWCLEKAAFSAKSKMKGLHLLEGTNTMSS